MVNILQWIKLWIKLPTGADCTSALKPIIFSREFGLSLTKIAPETKNNPINRGTMGREMCGQHIFEGSMFPQLGVRLDYSRMIDETGTDCLGQRFTETASCSKSGCQGYHPTGILLSSPMPNYLQSLGKVPCIISQVCCVRVVLISQINQFCVSVSTASSW